MGEAIQGSGAERPGILSYEDSSLNVTEDIKDHVQSLLELFEIEAIQDIRELDYGFQLKIKWLGFEDSESTWVSLDEINQAVPKLVQKFLMEYDADKFKNYLQ